MYEIHNPTTPLFFGKKPVMLGDKQATLLDVLEDALSSPGILGGLSADEIKMVCGMWEHMEKSLFTEFHDTFADAALLVVSRAHAFPMVAAIREELKNGEE